MTMALDLEVSASPGCITESGYAATKRRLKVAPQVLKTALIQSSLLFNGTTSKF